MATQRTTKKKAAKKTFTSAKKTGVPKLKKIWTVDALAANLAETQASMAKNHAKTEAAIADLTKSHAKTEAIVAETSAEVKKMAISIDKLTDNINELSKNVDNVSKNIGHVNNKLGSIVEYIVIPQIRHSINTVGEHSFTNIIPDVKIRDVIGNEKKTVSQIDVFLYNDTEAMAVEIKTDLHVGDVNDHVIRLQKLRKYEENPNINLVRKKLFGAVVGIIIDSRAKTLALEKGLYVVQIQEDEELLDITKPGTCKTW